MITKLGIYSLLAGLFFALFNGISSFMGAKNFWVNLTLTRMLGEETTEKIILWFSNASIQSFLDSFFYSWPVYVLLLILSVILLAIGMFVKTE